MLWPRVVARLNITRSPSTETCSIITTASAPAGTAAPVMICTHSPAPTAPSKPLPARISPMRAQRRARPRVIGAHGEAVADGAIEGRIVAIGLHRLGQHAPAGARKLDGFGDERRAQRACGGNDFLPRVLEGKHFAAQSQEANCVPEATMVASRSGPVEIIPISTSSWSEMNFR